MKFPLSFIVSLLKEHQMNAEPKPKKSTPNNLVDIVLDKLAPTRNIPIEQRLAKLTPEQTAQLQEIENKAITNFSGTIDELESALGMIRIGHHLGWRVLYLVHSKKTIRKYENILDIKIRNLFPEEGPSSERSVGLALAKRASNFWKVVSGEIKIENRRDIT
jgi:hypothetical protein